MMKRDIEDSVNRDIIIQPHTATWATAQHVFVFGFWDTASISDEVSFLTK